MIHGVIIKHLTLHEDERGWLAEIYRDDEDHYQPVMGYVSVTHPGVARGPHEHKYQSDCFVFVGPGDFELHLWDRRENSSTNGQYIKEVVGQSNPVMVLSRQVSFMAIRLLATKMLGLLTWQTNYIAELIKPKKWTKFVGSR